MLHVLSCLLHVFRWSSAARCPLHRVCCTFCVACRTFSDARGLLPVSRPRVPRRMVCAVCRLAHVRLSSRCTLLRCESSVACCRRHVPLSHVVSCPLPVPSYSVVCRMPPVARCRVTQRRHTRSASRRRSQFRAQWPARPAADRGARACVRACVARVWVARVTVSLRVGCACVGWIRAKAIQ
jgi:hypothetical protein